MGNDSIPSRVTGQTIIDEFFNLLKRVLSGALVPRNTSGIATDLSGDLGTESLRYKKAFIASGYFSAGDIKPHHSFDGLVGPGQGWMLMDGREINEENYDAEHGEGSWETFIGSSPLEGLLLPDTRNDTYLAGSEQTTADGESAIPQVGSNTHSHSIPNHNHQWYGWSNDPDSHDTVFIGSLASPTAARVNANPQPKNANVVGIAIQAAAQTLVGGSSPAANGSLWTSNTSISAGTSDGRPKSINVQFYMRII